MGASGDQPGNRLANLDVLRAVAIMLVLVFHFDGFDGKIGCVGEAINKFKQIKVKPKTVKKTRLNSSHNKAVQWSILSKSASEENLHLYPIIFGSHRHLYSIFYCASLQCLLRF